MNDEASGWQSRSVEATAERYPTPGQKCTLNRCGDLFMDYEARTFIGAECVVLKVTKAGLVQVALQDDPKRTYSAPLRNVVVTPNAEFSGCTRSAATPG